MPMEESINLENSDQCSIVVTADVESHIVR